MSEHHEIVGQVVETRAAAASACASACGYLAVQAAGGRRP